MCHTPQVRTVVGGVPRFPWRAGVMARVKEIYPYENTSVVNPQHIEDISIADARVKNNQWESSGKAVEKHMGIQLWQMDSTPGTSMSLFEL